MWTAQPTLACAAMSGMDVWLKRVERWRDTDLTAAEYAREVGCDQRIMAIAASGKLTTRRLRELESMPAPKPRRPRGCLAVRLAAAARSDADWMARHSEFERPRPDTWRRLTQRELWKRTVARIAATKAPSAQPEQA